MLRENVSLENNLSFGIVGNCKSAALINHCGSIVWCCLPNFDSPSIFAHVLDDEIGGIFKIIIDDSYSVTQKYSENSFLMPPRS